MRRVRLRYAPSPTGHLHIGGARTALFNYLYAKHFDGDFIFRLEDTDIERNIEGGEASQIENLRWLGLVIDESPDNPGKYAPYRQMERLDIYKGYAAQMLDNGQVYKCFCTSQELEESREAQLAKGYQSPRYDGKCRHLTKEEVEVLEAKRPYTLRLAVAESKEYVIDDMVRGRVVFDSKDIGDWVVVKQNGIPTYNFAVVVDDYLMEISHIFRGEEHLSNTPKQVMIYECFGWEPPRFAHMTLIVNDKRKKLSKRDETIMQFVSQYREAGYLPQAMFNFFGLLGFAPVGEKEIFTKEEFIEMFDVNRLSKSPSMFDKEKLKWINHEYIKALSFEDYKALCLPFLEKAYPLENYSTAWIDMLLDVYSKQVTFGQEIVDLACHFFEPTFSIDQDALTFLSENDVKAVIEAFKQAYCELGEVNVDTIKQAIKRVQEETGVKGKGLFMTIRIATTGQMHGPDLASSIVLFADKIEEHLDATLAKLG